MSIEDPKQSLGNCLAFHVRDHAQDKRDAWMYGIICGWDEESLRELQLRHGWSDEECERLRRLRQKWLELR